MAHESYTLPEDVTALSSDELDQHIADATAAFQAMRESPDLTTEDLPALRALAAGIETLRGEHANRQAAAEAANAEIAQLSAQILGEETRADEADAQAETAVVEETDVTDDVTASTRIAQKPLVRLNSVRKRLPEITSPEPGPARLKPEITASVDVPGYRAGETMALGDLVPGAIARANALKSQGGGSGLIASYHHPFPEELVVDDLGSPGEGSAVTLYASKQSRLKGGDLVASGGWCAPSETMYDFLSISCPDMLWDAPEVQLRRGGLRFFPTPVLDVANMTFVHTEAADIAGTPKPCFTVPCDEPVEVRCDAVGICVRAGLLTQRHFPELIAHYLSLTMVAQEIRVRQVLLNQVAAAATPVTIAASFGALSAVYSAVALQAADIIERFSLCDNIALEVVFPWWTRNLFLADVARRNGVSVEEVTTADVQAIYSSLGVRVQWARGITDVPFPVDNDPANNVIGGTTPATVWPEEIQFLIYPAGQVQIGRGADINLGVVYDHASLQTNDYTAAFAEECVATVVRAPDGAVRLVTVPVCPSGTTGGQVVQTCPVG